MSPYRHPAVVLVDNLVVVAGHPRASYHPRLAGKLIATSDAPYAVGFTFVIAQADAAVSAYAAQVVPGCAPLLAYLSARQMLTANWK
ncbi:hypothetical protein ACNKHO_22350 [Shigella flexneri]